MFEKLTGNEQMKARLRQLYEAGRIPQALLFAGHEGIGKKQFAIELAAAFVCETGNGCGNCKACRRTLNFDLPKADDKDAHLKIIFSGHSDVGMVVPYKRNILVDTIRDLEREAHFRPYEASVRIFIIDDAHKMNEAASNALLKTLEEPAESTYIFLVTSRPEKLLQTIRSRCQMTRFVPVLSDEIEQLLRVGGKFNDETAKLAARICEGNIGDALAIDMEKYLKMRSLMLDVLTSAVFDKGRASMLQTAELMNDAAHKEDYEKMLGVLEILIHDVWLIVQSSSANVVNFDIIDKLTELAENGDISDFSIWLEAIEILTGNLAVNINRKTATDALFLKMAA